MAALLGIVIVG